MRWRYSWKRDEEAEQELEKEDKALKKAATGWALRHGQGPDDALACAYMTFLEALAKKKGGAPLAPLLYKALSFRFTDLLRAKLKQGPLPLTETEEKGPFYRPSLLERATPDAREVITLVCLKRDVLLEDMEDQQPLSWRWRLIWYLQEMGWGLRRVLESFEEVREALRR